MPLNESLTWSSLACCRKLSGLLWIIELLSSWPVWPVLFLSVGRQGDGPCIDAHDPSRTGSVVVACALRPLSRSLSSSPAPTGYHSFIFYSQQSNVRLWRKANYACLLYHPCVPRLPGQLVSKIGCFASFLTLELDGGICLLPQAEALLRSGTAESSLCLQCPPWK